MNVQLQNVIEKVSGRGYTLTLMEDGLTLAEIGMQDTGASVPSVTEVEKVNEATDVTDEMVKVDATEVTEAESEKRERSVHLTFREISGVSLEPGDPHELLIHSDKGEFAFVLVNNPHYQAHKLADLLKQAVSGAQQARA